MKSTVPSFLFFCALFLTVQSLHSQAADSLNYYTTIVNNPTKPDDLAKAHTFFTQERLKHAKNKNQVTNEIFAIQHLATIQKKLGIASQSELLHLECLRLLDAVKNKDDWYTTSYMSSINELGKIYRERDDYKQALALYDEALSTAASLTHTAILLNNKGHVYEFKNELQTALSFYKAAYEKALEAANTVETARTLSNLSNVKAKLHLPDAEKGLLQALNLRMVNNYPSELASSYDHLTRFYQQQKDTAQMKKYADSFLELATKTGIMEQLQSALRLKIETGEHRYANEYILINARLTNLKEQQRNDFNYYVYKNEKKEKELAVSKLHTERLLYLLLFITLAAISIYVVLKYKHKKEKLHEVYNTETRISRKIHDEVANDVYNVMTQLQTGSINDKQLLDDLENIYNRTRDISKQHSSIDLAIPYEELLNDLLLSFNDAHRKIITKGLKIVHWENLNDMQKTTLYRVFQELLINMRKHSNATLTFIECYHTDNLIHISYKDNGIGTNLVKGNGLQNTENRIASINGTIIFESEVHKGFRATITI